MTFLKLLGGAIAAATLAFAPAAMAKGPNALDAYVAKRDPAFAWKVVGPVSGPGYHGAVLEMTSQSWTTETMLPGQDLWKHWVTVIVPDNVTSDKAFLYITGGDKGDPAPAKAVDRFAKLAVETSSVVVELDDVPNQPLRFSDEPKDHVEDEIIAYLQARFAKNHDPNQLLRLPMVKSGTQAMTATQQYLASAQGGGLKVNGFVVAGGSKRGWTTWLVGAVDRRVVGIVPIVISVLNVEATAIHHWRAMGYFSPALEDYVHYRLIPDMIGKPGLAGVNLIEDPLNYQDRAQMRIPKFVINAVGDEYFPPDNTRYGYYRVADPKRLRMIPNSKHSTSGTDIMESITAFHDAVIHNRPIPNFQWGVRKTDGAIVVRSKVRPREVYLWQGSNPKARDFRVDTIGKAFTPTRLKPQKDGSYVGNVPRPKNGYTAYFVEVLYDSGTKYPFKFTSEVYVKPDVLPYRWEDARPITAPEATK
jgi:PhoPQ-activated pathogenicity-related protein